MSTSPPDPIPVAKHADPLPTAAGDASSAPGANASSRSAGNDKKIPRAVWIGAGIGGFLVLVVLCAGSVAGVLTLAGVGPLARPAIVGKWEYAQGGHAFWEFKSDGTGLMQAKGPWEGMDFEMKFNWSIDNSGKEPVLLIDSTKMEQKKGAFGVERIPPTKTHYHFTREGNTLTLAPLGAAEKSVVLRKIP